ncbi:MAG: UDP-N-acetylmuramoyl-L-alanyl-D-glutamate--2,6-diaminopimelate ligase [Erysipelotrichaceae bacterium]|nr:UDP-N-acetylmuramoyl-L-alanyl-D-glutamate--2,6-diaminopimelate ligase [Erysipelotrichaceae bacterium]
MKLSSLFKQHKGPDVEITGLSINTQTIKPGDLFICIKGASVDRHDFIDKAIENGAVALVTSRDVETTVPYVKLDNPNESMREIYSTFYDHPEEKLTLIGVTGTDGKTSTTTIIQKLIGSDKCGYIGTNGYSCHAFNRETDNTTPGIDAMYRILNEFVEAGCKYVAMETSSEAFYYNRLKGMHFTIGALTNIDKEHLNTHKTLENYIACKKMLFKQSDKSVFNSNDKHFEEVKTDVSDYVSYGYKDSDNLQINSYELRPDGTDITFTYKNNKYDIKSPLLGIFNIENLACALLSCLNLGFELEDLLKNLPSLSIDGRMTSVDMGQNFYVLVDYAHTPNGLTRLFEFTNLLKVNRKIVVTGNAGGRDASKRKYVGELCVNNNDHVIFCYEDPRFEDPLNVIKDLTELVQDKNNYETVVDRGEAIAKAINIAEENDLVMILGKGNEDWEEIQGEFIEFNDINEAKKALKKRLNP